MELNPNDVALLLMLSEKEIKQLIKKKEIPHYFLQDKIVLNKHQIIEWALSKNMPLNISGHQKMSEYQIESLQNILEEDSFHYGCELVESDYIEQMVSLLKVDENIDRDVISTLLRSRESLMSTAIGNGISLPHPRVPIMLGRDKPLLNFFFPNKLLNLDSIDGKPVNTLILLISQSIKQHLSLLAHLSFLLSNEKIRIALETRLEYDEIMKLICEIEGTRLVSK
jgi:PTS system nitrogen regulatory IIA component